MSIPASIILLGVVPAILAVIFGLIGRGRARRGEATNPGQALTGVILGAVGIALFILVLIAVIVDIHHRHVCQQDPFASGCSESD